MQSGRVRGLLFARRFETAQRSFEHGAGGQSRPFAGCLRQRRRRVPLQRGACEQAHPFEESKPARPRTALHGLPMLERFGQLLSVDLNPFALEPNQSAHRSQEFFQLCFAQRLPVERDANGEIEQGVRAQ